MPCYINAINYKISKSRFIVPRLFFFLEIDDESQIITKSFEKYTEILPVWIWIFWIPQLLISLGRKKGEANNGEKILKVICLLYPQSIFYHLLKFALQNRESNSRTTNNSIQSQFLLFFQNSRLQWRKY